MVTPVKSKSAAVQISIFGRGSCVSEIIIIGAVTIESTVGVKRKGALIISGIVSHKVVYVIQREVRMLFWRGFGEKVIEDHLIRPDKVK